MKLRFLMLPLLLAAGAGAQLPRAWVQAGGGLGTSSSYVYEDNLIAAAELRAGVRLTSMLGAEVSGLIAAPIFTGDRVTNLVLCLGPDRQPVPCPGNSGAYFSVSGVGGSVVVGAGSRTRLSLGSGSYVLPPSLYLPSTRVLGIGAGADYDALVAHPSLTVGIHPIFMPNVHGHRTWFVPLEIGVRAW